MEWYLAYLILGAVAGFLAGLFGVGGGLVLVPVLLLMFDAQHFTPEHTMHLALGTAMATISVASGGRVNSASVTGKFAATPTGSCVETAAKSAKFPACQSMTFPWPFTLSPR